MSELVLTLAGPLPGRLDATPLTPERLAEKCRDDILQVPVSFEDGTTTTTGELFRVRGRPCQCLRFEGDMSSVDRIGAGMASGSVTIEGNAGDEAGRRMTGGRLQIEGNAGHRAGLEMAGGSLVVRGSAGPGTGGASAGAKRGMTGGEIIVFGDSGTGTGACLRRGVIAVGGRVGPDAGHAAIAGTILAVGGFAVPAGRWLKRASLISLTEMTVPPGFEYACTGSPSYLPTLCRHLDRTYGFSVDPRFLNGRYRFYRGDPAESGRGEILIWASE